MIRRSNLVFLCLLTLALFSARWPASLSAQQCSPPPSDSVLSSGAPLSDDPASFVSASGGHFLVDGHPFRHVGVNEADFVYEGGENSDLWNDTWFLRQGGIKQVRVFLANDAYTTPQIICRLENALGVAWSHGIRLTVVLTNFYYATHYGHDGGPDESRGHTAVRGDDITNAYTETCCGTQVLGDAWVDNGYRQNYKPFVEEVVNHFKNDGRIFAWEIVNELPVRLNRSSKSGGLDTESAIAFYRDMATAIKAIDPNHMVAPGIICTAWMPLDTDDQKRRLYELMDYVVEHHYPLDPNGGSLNDDVLAVRYGKPLVIEEFGIHQNLTSHDSIMPMVNDFFDLAYAEAPLKNADAIMVWGVDFGWDRGSGDANVGPGDQHLENDYLQLWRENADWTRPSPRYKDVEEGSTFYTHIECLADHRVIGGLADWVNDTDNDKFKPADPITRGQAIKALVRAMDFELPAIGEAHFTDVPPSSPYYRYVEAARTLEIIIGYPDGTFRPDAFLTRGQVCKIIILAAQVKYHWPFDWTNAPHFVDVAGPNPGPQDTFYDYIETAFNHNMIHGYPGGYFRPSETTTRGQFAQMLAQAISCSGTSDSPSSPSFESQGDNR
jgi:hypothetical protein